MTRIVLIVLALVFVASGVAFAQAPNAIMEHYRAYQVALEANDLVAAEAAAERALAASEARDGDGGNTAALAFNLATVRFLQSKPQQALAPAERALALAEAQGEAARVSPDLARLLIGRARVALDLPEGGPALAAALEAAQTARLPAEEIYDAALELGQYGLKRREYPLARQAWSIAANYAEGSRFPAAFALGRARVGAAAALAMEEVSSRGRHRGRLTIEGATTVRRELTEAVTLLAPLAEARSPDDDLTLAQAAYAEALAWRAVMRAKVSSDGLRLPPEAQDEAQGDGAGEIDVPSASVVQPRCWVRFRYDGIVSDLFPARALDDGQLAGVAVRFRLNEAGEVTEARTVAVVGREEFGRAVENARRRWRAELMDDSPPNCRMAMTVIGSVSFTLR